MEIRFFILLLLFIANNIYSQDNTKVKIIDTDTSSYFYKSKKDILPQINLPNLLNSKYVYYNRFWFDGSKVIDIWKDGDSIKGILTNYIHRSHKEKEEIIFETIILNDSVVKFIDSLYKTNELEKIPSDDKIKSWKSNYLHGKCYFFENSHNKNVSFKSYYCPSFQIDLMEAKLISTFIIKVDSILNLDSIYKKFRSKMYKNGCYNSGDIWQSCIKNNFLNTEFISSRNLYYGIGLTAFVDRIKSNRIDISLHSALRIDNKNQSDIIMRINKEYLFFSKKSINKDWATYSFRKRFFRNDTYLHNAINNKFTYTFSTKKFFPISFGIDYLSNIKNEIGLILGMNYYQNKLKYYFSYQASVFKSHVDYQIDIGRLYRIKFIHQTFVASVFYEKFLSNKDFGIRISKTIF